MDPIAANLQSILNALQAASSTQALTTLETPALAALLGLGQEVDLLLQALEPEGAVLELPSGQTLYAQGALPYAEGTQLRVRVEPAPAGEVGLRLQVQEARPPALPAILTPLAQGEAWSLMSRLQDAQAAPELEPLAQLLRLFMGAGSAAETSSATMANPENQVALPSQVGLTAEIQAWPASVAQGLATILGAADSSPAALATLVLNLVQGDIHGALAPSLAPATAAPSLDQPRLSSSAALEADSGPSPEPSQILDSLQGFLAKHPEIPQEQRETLETWMNTSPAEAAGSGSELQHLLETSSQRETVVPSESSVSPQAMASQVLQHFQLLVAQHPELPLEQQDFLGVWLRQILAKGSSDGFELPNRATLAPREGQGAPQAPSQPSAALTTSRANASAASTPSSLGPVAQGLQALIQTRGVAPAALPESWEAWVRGAVRTLADPLASPREAPFHALQGQERTGFFEVPLPWATQSSLQLWVEQDAQRGRGGSGDGTRRVLLGLRFSRLGETRIGMESGSGSLRVRIWTEHPEVLQSESANLESELTGLGTPVELRVLPLVPGPDGTILSLRAAATGSSLQAMG